MPTFKNLNSLFDYLNANVVIIMQQIVNEEVIPIMLDVIKKEVYDAYEPTLYQRRYANDGLLDQTNFDVDMDIRSNIIEIKVRNNTKPNGEYNQPYLDVMIVEGTPKMPMKRDFYEATREVLRTQLPYIVKQKFAQHGLKGNLSINIL